MEQSYQLPNCLYMMGSQPRLDDIFISPSSFIEFFQKYVKVLKKKAKICLLCSYIQISIRLFSYKKGAKSCLNTHFACLFFNGAKLTTTKSAITFLFFSRIRRLCCCWLIVFCCSYCSCGCVWSLFCYAVLCVFSSFAVISWRTREPVTLI